VAVEEDGAVPLIRNGGEPLGGAYIASELGEVIVCQCGWSWSQNSQDEDER